MAFVKCWYMRKMQNADFLFIWYRIMHSSFSYRWFFVQFFFEMSSSGVGTTEINWLQTWFLSGRNGFSNFEGRFASDEIEKEEWIDTKNQPSTVRSPHLNHLKSLNFLFYVLPVETTFNCKREFVFCLCWHRKSLIIIYG